MEILSSPVSQVAHSALDVLSYQQQLLAQNIANANVEGYQPKYINFDAVMSDISSPGFNKNMTEDLLSQYTEVRTSTVELDLELIQMQETVLQYKSLLDALSRRGALMKTVLGGEK